MNKTFLNKVRTLLLEEKAQLLKQAAGQEVEIDTDGDETDEIQGNMLTDMINQLNSRNSARLALIEAALKRVDDGSYGKCQDCEEAIPEKRLLANPHFQTCVSCAEEREAEDKNRKRF